MTRLCLPRESLACETSLVNLQVHALCHICVPGNVSVFLEMFLHLFFFFFFGGERACLLTHAKVAGTRLPFSKYSGTVHAQMCCHPETKSKVHPRRKKSTLPGGLPSFAFQPVYKHLPAACNMALLLVVGFNEFDSLAFGHNEGDPLVLSTCGANPH